VSLGWRLQIIKPVVEAAGYLRFKGKNRAGRGSRPVSSSGIHQLPDNVEATRPMTLYAKSGRGHLQQGT
jgi:hypothetical protein